MYEIHPSFAISSACTMEIEFYLCFLAKILVQLW